ncbi:MAG: hypothetical protein WA867_08695, partial [Candidatus Acidiferrales bacterium]
NGFRERKRPWRRSTRAERYGTACKCEGHGARAVNYSAHYDGNGAERDNDTSSDARHADEKSVDQ